ncbi:MAG: HAMP domain-containing histidine kinase [Rikenellaceae bacterium]|nr:HAMP domain-containing histidine kinase [Rikenellaceae bacterium]
MKRIPVLILLLFISFSASAQIQNRLNVDEKIFKIYSEGRLQPYDESNVALGDSLFAVGVARNDYKIKALALNLKLSPLLAQNDLLTLQEVIEEMKSIRSDHPDINDIYIAAMYTYCQALTLSNQISTALLNAREMSRVARESGDSFGMMMSYRTLGFIYDYRGNNQMAYNSYLAALPLCKEAGADQELFSIHVLIAEQLISMKRFEEAEMYLAMVQEECNPNIPWASSQTQVLRFLLYYEGYKPEIYGDSINILMNDNNLEGIIDEETQYTLSALFYRSQKRYNEALQIVDNITNDIKRKLLKADILEDIGDYKEALSLYHSLIYAKDSINNVIQSEDIAMMDAELNLSSMKMKAEIAESQRNNIIAYSLIILLAFLILFLVVMYRRRKKQSKELEEHNIQLQKAQQETQDALEKATEASKAKQRFVQNMSHEVRTPLNAIVGFSQLLSMPDGFLTQGERDQYRGYVMNNSDILTMLVDDILNTSDLDSGNYQIFVSASRCNEIASSAMTCVQFRLPDNLKFYMTTDLPDDFSIETDPRRVQQILINYFTNAFKHTKVGEIHIHCGIMGLEGKVSPEKLEALASEGGMVYFSVADTGTGVPADQAESIFERFSKLDPFVQGTGLGLNICREIATKLGGRSYLDTDYVPPKPYETGACFFLTLPIKYPKKEQASNEQ